MEPLAILAPLAERIRAERAEFTRVRFPCDRYRRDFSGFCHDILGYVPWSKQDEVAELVIDGMLSGSPIKVLLFGGHKWGKSHTLASLALWHFCSWPDALVVLCAPGQIQLLDPLWKTITILHSGSGLCADCRDEDPKTPRPCPHSACIDGTLYREPTPEGLVSSDRRRAIFGHTTSEVKRVTGHSGPRVLYILDESAGINRTIFPGIEGNMAGVVNGGIVMAGNPIDPNSYFGQQIEKGKHGQGEYQLVHCSSWETPNAQSGQILIPGLATRGWCEARRQAWGENDWRYIERVIGEHAAKQAGQLITSIDVEAAKLRRDLSKASGTIFIGVDLAGGSGGDLSVIAPRQGDQLWDFVVVPGPFEDVASELERILMGTDDKVVVNYDPHGVGYHFGPYLERLAKKYGWRLEFHPLVLSGSGGPQFGTYRDEILSTFADAVREWLAIPACEEFEEECVSLEFDRGEKNERFGRKDRIERKSVTRRKLGGRSPDRLEAAAYSLANDAGLPTPRGQLAPAEIDALEEPVAPGGAPSLGPVSPTRMARYAAQFTARGRRGGR